MQKEKINDARLTSTMEQPKTFGWFAAQEGGKNGTWRSDVTYDQIVQFKPQLTFSFEDFSSCDSGFCGV